MNDFKNYNPLFFLSSLWAWWLTVSFFVYIMFLTKHPETPVPTFNSILPILQNWDIFTQALIIFSLVWVLFFWIMHFYLLIKNIKNFNKFSKTENYQKLKKSPSEVTLMAIPLTVAMSLNALFSMSLLFIPNIWNVIEYLFPFSIIWFIIIWFYSLRIFWDYFSRIIISWDDDLESKHNNLSQMIAIFAFSMIWVGFSGSAAMSHNEIVSAIWMLFATFFITISVFLIIIKISIWFKSMLKKWISTEASPSMWLMIPIITIIWIALVRITMWLDHNFWINHQPMWLFILTTILASIQILFWFIWYKIMKANSYFKNYLNWDQKSAWSYTLICPWVASFVFWMFFVHYWLIKTNLITQFWITHFILLLILFYIQIITIKTLFKLNKKFL